MFIFMIGSTEFSFLKGDDFIYISSYAVAKKIMCRRKKKNEEDLFHSTDSTAPDGRILQMM